jgi:acetyl esterase/lipase
MLSDSDIIYAHAGAMDLRLDIYRLPAARADLPKTNAAILFLHGGGWQRGSKEMMRAVATSMAERGFVGVASQYRLSGQAPWPAHIHDVKAAIRWVRAHAEELGIDPARIILWGTSAGAHLALLAAGTPNDPAFEGEIGPPGVSSAVAAVVAVHPPTSFYYGPLDRHHSTPATALMGDAATEAAARAASPLSHVSPSFPPTLLLHGTEDKVVHHSASQRMLDALRTAHAPADLHLFHGHAHGFVMVPSMRAAVTAEAALFLDRTIIDPEKYRQEIWEHSLFAGRGRQGAAAS